MIVANPIIQALLEEERNEFTLLELAISELAECKSAEIAFDIAKEYINTRNEDAPIHLQSFEKAIERIYNLGVYLEEYPEREYETNSYHTPYRDKIENILYTLFQ